MRIFSCHHVAPERVLNTSLFQTFPLTVEGDIAENPGRGREFDNRLSEMRHQHYIWKNHKSRDMVGFEHYRRLFLITGSDTKRIARSYPDVYAMMQMSALYRTHHFYVSSAVLNQYLDYRESLTEAELAGIEAHLGAFDIVTVPSEQRNMLEMINMSWEDMENYVKQTRFFNEAPELELAVPHQCYWLNCYVMKREIFDEYMSFAFNALDIYEANMLDPKPGPRFFGHVTERLFSIYLSRKRVLNPHLKVLELPTMWYHTDLDPNGGTITHDFRHDIHVAEQRGREAARAEIVAAVDADAP